MLAEKADILENGACGIGAGANGSGVFSGGVIAIALYYGGANGYGERDAVMTWLETLDDRKFSVLRCDWANRRNDPPVPIFIWKD